MIENIFIQDAVKLVLPLAKEGTITNDYDRGISSLAFQIRKMGLKAAIALYSAHGDKTKNELCEIVFCLMKTNTGLVDSKASSFLDWVLRIQDDELELTVDSAIVDAISAVKLAIRTFEVLKDPEQIEGVENAD